MKTGKNNISILKHCYGCGVCSVGCPHKIIDIELSSTGFYVPKINNTEKCTDCGLCLSSCSYYQQAEINKDVKRAFAGWSNDSVIRHISSSGGIAYELAKKGISDGFIFCGVKYESKTNRAVHYLSETIDDLKYSLGSKYIPSFTADAFKQLFDKRKYTVVGTPCQIASLRLLIKKRRIEDNFILIDFYCHGVPSINVWNKYLKERKINILAYDNIIWRDKRYGWHDSWYIVAKDKNGAEKYRSTNVGADLFFQFFLQHYALSPCCVDSCKYKQTSSSADIRIGDLWGNTYAKEEKGVSGILALTDRGLSFLNSVTNITLIDQPYNIVGEGQMRTNASKPSTYYLAQRLLATKMSLSAILNVLRNTEAVLTLPGRIINKIKTSI